MLLFVNVYINIYFKSVILYSSNVSKSSSWLLLVQYLRNLWWTFLVFLFCWLSSLYLSGTQTTEKLIMYVYGTYWTRWKLLVLWYCPLCTHMASKLLKKPQNQKLIFYFFFVSVHFSLNPHAFYYLDWQNLENC